MLVLVLVGVDVIGAVSNRVSNMVLAVVVVVVWMLYPSRSVNILFNLHHYYSVYMEYKALGARQTSNPQCNAKVSL